MLCKVQRGGKMRIKISGELCLSGGRLVIPVRLEQGFRKMEGQSPERVSRALQSLSIQERCGMLSFGEGEAWLNFLVKYDRGNQHVR